MTRRRTWAARLLSGLALGLVFGLMLGGLSGCSLLPKKDADTAGSGAPAAPLVPAVQLVIEAPDALRTLLARYLDVARLQALPANESLNPQEWARLVAATPAQARELLQTEGYFDAQVSARREPPPEGSSALPVLRISVTPGPRVVVDQLAVRSQGAVAERAAQGDADAQALRQGLGEGLPLRLGQPFRNPDWGDAKQAVLTRLRAGGYATAQLANSQADIDVPSQRAQLQIEADSGPLFKAGELQISGLKAHDAETVRHLAGFGPGAPLTEAQLLDYQDRLRRAGLFEAASVSFEPDAARADATPLQVHVSELPLRQSTIGVGISANSGPRTTVEFIHRRPFGWPVVANNKAEWGRDRQAWTGDFQSHPLEGFYRRLVGVQIDREISNTDVVLSQRLRVGRSQDTPRIGRLTFLELLHSRKGELDATARGVTPVTSASALTANVQVVWRQLDSPLLPTDGYTVALQTAAGQASSRNGPDGPVAVLYGRATAYRPLGERWYAQARLEMGQLFKRDNVVVPDALGFRAGGDESVRGYAYRSLAPTDASGATVSGTRLITTSLELARPITERLPELWGATFIDAGRATDSWKGQRLAVGYGVGLRFRSPIGPLRLDLARAHELQRWRLHLSVGISL